MVAYKIQGENKSVFGDERFNRSIRFDGVYTEEQKEVLVSQMVHHFRCCDDDGTTYFWGVCSDCDSEDAFYPLDSVGEAYGCTYIEYKNPQTNEYEML